MKNILVAELLRNIAQLLEIKEELIFKIRAYEKAALVISFVNDCSDATKNFVKVLGTQLLGKPSLYF